MEQRLALQHPLLQLLLLSPILLSKVYGFWPLAFLVSSRSNPIPAIESSGLCSKQLTNELCSIAELHSLDSFGHVDTIFFFRVFLCHNHIPIMYDNLLGFFESFAVIECISQREFTELMGNWLRKRSIDSYQV